MKRAGAPDPVRSALMGRVRQKGTAAELAVGASLRRCGRAYRLNVKALPGSPDFANRKDAWAIFVHGCFWHRHSGCSRATSPKTNAQFWEAKFAANRTRDGAALAALEGRAFRTLVVWECETFDPDRLDAALSAFFESFSKPEHPQNAGSDRRLAR